MVLWRNVIMHPTEILNPTERRSSKAYLVSELRKAVYKWREDGYPGMTDTTRELLHLRKV